ncbi:DNA cytosine methyltransferase [Streptomyces sp. H27-H1]|uniref:DNA cytosine methyltransferase n=1 Tax=Streptomyces sp. H27-H1 TaxID=2996461 RepID=UPI002270CACA|nr:DNA cytosine methyltransferase [Streptomyces sp. H27-H1]MCY0926252.1 DNA cytosine methyltransferase [Streptomyces sp. H27-H1]
MPILELCAGYGGLGIAVEALTGDKVTVVAEVDEAASRILAHRFPSAPNIGDITACDWAQLLGQVDIITAGFPCQDISNAGKREGIDGGRSGIYRNVVEAVHILRPRLVFLENVSAIRSRGLWQVVTDLAAIGYDVRWTCLRASDVGAPHHRDRWFAVAYPAGRVPDSEGFRRTAWGAEPTEQQRAVRRPSGARGELPSDSDSPRLEVGGIEPAWDEQQAPVGSGACPEDPDGAARPERGSAAPGQAEEGGGTAPLSMMKSASYFPTPTASDGTGGAGTSPNRKGGENLRTAVTHLPSGGETTFPPSDGGSS